MTYNPEIHHRRSIRLKEYDYSQEGSYFITICTHNREFLFGKISNGEMILNEYGEIVEKCWFDLPNHYWYIALNEFIVMPNHFHCIISMTSGTSVMAPGSVVGAGLKPAPTLPEIVRALKTFSARRINEIRKTTGIPVWQRNYYEHIIRDDESYYQISEYIKNNPAHWVEDDYYGK